MPPVIARHTPPPSPPLGANLVLLLMLLTLHCAMGTGVFELQILEFSNYRLELSSGACCGGSERGARSSCAAPCRTRFTLCLKEYQSVAAPGACSFGRASSPVLGTDSFTLAEPLYTLALPFSFRWTRSFTLILQAYDDFYTAENTTSEESGLIEEAGWSGIVEPGSTWHALRHAGNAAAVAYRVRVLCQPNYYNTTCTTFCRPRDDNFGHYSCSSAGSKRCLPGWQGDNCDKPVCKEGCHPIHGRCDRPGECDCRPGWRGELCSECQPYPGCKHGYCNGSSWDCTCDTNWGGILCDQDLNYCGTHEPCQHGGTCENTAPDQYLCTCAEGFSGTECERVDNPCAPQPCQHGHCALSPTAAVAPGASGAGSGFTCTCEPGWTGTLCDTDIDDCASSPCLNLATCHDLLDAFRCDCPSGWQGHTCSEDVDECGMKTAGATEKSLGPCVNAASCKNSPGGYSCTCLAGWTGRDCETNIDDCTGQCLNGATCIDLVDDFHCACAAGYAGRTCARDVDDCASHPCRNGGECIDLLNDYRCICLVGFTGKDCEDDRDHCASAPCANNAPCYTAQNDYYCHCAPGWTGKNCTQRTNNDHVDECLSAPCQNNGSCIDAVDDFECLCRDGWTGKTCSTPSGIVNAGCEKLSCANGGTCVRDGQESRCECSPAWSGPSCDVQLLPVVPTVPATSPTTLCTCANGGSCMRDERGSLACACVAGWGGTRCDRQLGACASQPCHNGGHCSGGPGWWVCTCLPGWGGTDCSVPACEPSCPAPAICSSRRRCLCPSNLPVTATRRCLELIAGLGADADEEVNEHEDWEDGGEDGEEEFSGGSCDAGEHDGIWWWGCNACWCERGTTVCTRLWCGLPDCLAPSSQPCRTDEVCVPAAPILCLRAPCTALGECRRVSGRRVEPPALPAPPSCWPGTRPSTTSPTAPAPTSRGCARAQLPLARERLARGAHVERACVALRRALAAALAAPARTVLGAPPPPPLVLLCDLAPDDDDALDLALWVGDDESVDEERALAAAIRALNELVSRRRLAAHPLLGAALRLRIPHETTTPPGAAPREAHTPAGLLATAVTIPLVLLITAAVAVVIFLRRRRAATAVASALADRSNRHDEEKSNNLQNEENLRRYANPLRAASDSLPRAHSLYKAPNADARNNTGVAPTRDKELTKRALPPPAHLTAPPARPAILAPPERLTVLV